MNESKLVCGVGVTDADYTVSKVVNGKNVKCPFYMRWTNMITRCYSAKALRARPSYIGCSVDSKWLVFSSFKVWMEKQDWEL